MARESTLSISLTPRLKAYVRKKVASGQYESASEVIRQGLRTLQEKEAADRHYWEDVRRKVAEAREDIAKGAVVDGPAFMASRIAALKDLPARSKGRSRKTA